MVKSGNYHFEKNETFILSVKYGTVPYFIERAAGEGEGITFIKPNIETLF